MEEENKIYPHVYEKMEDWPIHKLHQDRKAFVQEITEFTVDRLMKGKTEAVTEMIGKTAYLEQIRIKEEPWKVDRSKNDVNLQAQVNATNGSRAS